ncbi:SCP2 sterol-binding domain-containing protein [Nocardia amamiensis]|uniref:SCP2 sterol-binding domain-containing protein n=1 Tax=Nocardia TaxID=1817 RepID=UPI003402DA90
MTRTLVLHAIFAEMPLRLLGDRVSGVESVVCWRIGQPQQVWTVTVAGAACTVHEGNSTVRPTVTLELETVPFLRMIAGQVGGMALMTTGRLRIKGSLTAARKIEDWFARD